MPSAGVAPGNVEAPPPPTVATRRRAGHAARHREAANRVLHERGRPASRKAGFPARPVSAVVEFTVFGFSLKVFLDSF